MAHSDPLDVPAGVPAERADALYGLALDEFTPARDALVRELREAGERAAATWVKGLRKPSAAAWAVNQLARTQKGDAKRLLAAGEKLRAAHERLLSGKGDAGRLRDAAERESEAVRKLRASAPGLLDRDGHAPSPATLDKVAQTLHAVAVDERARAEFACGRLTREHRASGLGPLGAGAPAPRRGGAKKRPSAAREREAQKAARERERERERAREIREAERAVREAEREAERAQRRLDDATSALERARARR